MEFTTSFELQSQTTRLLGESSENQTDGSFTLSAALFQGTWFGSNNAQTHRPQFCDRWSIADSHAGLFPLQSPLLRKSWLVSFPLLNYMLKFSRFSCLSWDQMLSATVMAQILERPGLLATFALFSCVFGATLLVFGSTSARPTRIKPGWFEQGYILGKNHNQVSRIKNQDVCDKDASPASRFFFQSARVTTLFIFGAVWCLFHRLLLRFTHISCNFLGFLCNIPGRSDHWAYHDLFWGFHSSRACGWAPWQYHNSSSD